MRLPLAALLLASAAFPSTVSAQTVVAQNDVAQAAQAQPAAPSARPEDVKVNQLIVYGEEKCPPSTDEEITVCARLPEDERFRIPPNLRGDPNAPANEAWAVKAQELEYVGRSGIGSCTPIGPGGGIGCFQQLVREAKAERANSDEVNWTRLVEDARQERLGRIDAASDALEQQIKQEEAAKAP
jgi:hypothetical protein